MRLRKRERVCCAGSWSTSALLSGDRSAAIHARVDDFKGPPPGNASRQDHLTAPQTNGRNQLHRSQSPQLMHLSCLDSTRRVETGRSAQLPSQGASILTLTASRRKERTSMSSRKVGLEGKEGFHEESKLQEVSTGEDVMDREADRGTLSRGG